MCYNESMIETKTQLIKGLEAYYQQSHADTYKIDIPNWLPDIACIRAQFHNDDEHFNMVFIVSTQEAEKIFEEEEWRDDNDSNNDLFFDVCGKRIRQQGIDGDLFLDNILPA